MPILPIVLGLALLGGIVALVLSRTSWRWYNITLVALSMLLSVVWFYFAARTLKMQENWRTEVAQFEKDINELNKQNELLIRGNPQAEPPTPSLAQLKLSVEKMLQNRGRRWDKVGRKSVSPAGVIVATVDHPEPHGIEPKTILYVFDDAAAKDNGHLLGEFEATAVAGQQVTLTPVLPLRPTQLQRLNAKRNGPLVLYDVMPADSHEAFAELDEAARSAAFPSSVPAAVKQEYAKDQNAPAADEKQTDRIWRRVKALKDFDVTRGQGKDKETQHVTQGTELLLDPKSAQERIAAGEVEPVAENDKVYMRPLRDYAHLYRDLNVQIDGLLRTTAEVDDRLATIAEAQRKVEKDIAYRNDEIAALKQDLGRFQGELDIMRKHVAALEQRIDETDRARRQMFASNQQLESQLSMLVHRAADEINRRVISQVNSKSAPAVPSAPPD